MSQNACYIICVTQYMNMLWLVISVYSWWSVVQHYCLHTHTGDLCQVPTWTVTWKKLSSDFLNLYHVKISTCSPKASANVDYAYKHMNKWFSRRNLNSQVIWNWEKAINILVQSLSSSCPPPEVFLPEGQSMQSVLRGMSWYLPTGQSVQLSSSMNWPGGQSPIGTQKMMI